MFQNNKGIISGLKQEDSTAKEQNIIHVMDDATSIAQVRIGTEFKDDIAEATHYILDDHLGASTSRLNNTGGLIDRQEYYPFGDSSLRTFDKKRYRYVGKEKDAESGLYYFGARYYSPWTCRFISVDPLAADYPYLTPYNYAGNKPITHKDIDGLQSTGDEPVSGGGGQQGGDDKIYNGGILPEVVITGVKELTEKDIHNMGAGTEFSLFKAVTNYEKYSTEEDFSSLGTYTKNPTQSNEPYHPNPNYHGDRKTYYNDLFIANENYNFSNFASVTVGNLISGEGPENTVFGKDHSINQFMRQIDIVRDAVNQWKKDNSNLPLSEQGTFNKHINYTPIQAVMDLLDSFLMNRDFTTPEQVIGGANVEINPLEDGLLEIRIFNVTSIGSGNIENGKSYMRQPGFEGSQAYRNISQTFIFNYQWR